MKISIVIPTLDESQLIESTIQACWEADAEEIIVCDGGSRDDTRQIAHRMSCLLVETLAGRGRQMAAGAQRAGGDVLAFVHADTQIGKDSLSQIRDHLAKSGHPLAWGCFRQSIAAHGRRYRWLEKGNAWRAAKRGLVYGDQTMWISRELYEQVGGFSEIPLMEDVIISDALKKICPPVVLPGPVTIPGRHWKRKGVLRTTIRNWYLFQMFRMGASPQNLAKRYRSS